MQKINFKKDIKFRNNKIRIKKHNLSHLHKESDLFFDWYLKNNSKKKEFKKNKNKIKKELNIFIKSSIFKKCVLYTEIFTPLI